MTDHQRSTKPVLRLVWNADAKKAPLPWALVVQRLYQKPWLLGDAELDFVRTLVTAGWIVPDDAAELRRIARRVLGRSIR